MHVPFSMSDEPDLGDEFKGIGGDYEHIEPTPIDKPIYTQEQMNKVILANLNNISTYRNEIVELDDNLMYARDALRDVLDWINCSQSLSALRAIVKRGLRE